MTPEEKLLMAILEPEKLFKKILETELERITEEYELLIEGRLLKLKELEEAIRIIKEKRVDADLLLNSESAKDYNRFSKNVNEGLNLREKEFDLLKGVLK